MSMPQQQGGSAAVSDWQKKLNQLKQQQQQRGATSAGSASVVRPVPPSSAAAPAAVPTSSRSPPVSLRTAPPTSAPANSREAILQRAGAWKAPSPSPSSSSSSSPPPSTYQHPLPPKPTDISAAPPPHHQPQPQQQQGSVAISGPVAGPGSSSLAAQAAAMPRTGTTSHTRQPSVDDIRRKAQMWSSAPVAAAPGATAAPATQPQSQPAPSQPRINTGVVVPGPRASQYSSPSVSRQSPAMPGSGAPMSGPTGAGAATTFSRGGMDKAAWRKSRAMVRQSRVFANNQLSSILENVTVLERTIAAVEAARQLAEENVIEIAVAKMEEDERVMQLAEKLSAVIRSMDAMSTDELRAKLTEVRDGLVSNAPESGAVTSQPLSGAGMPEPPPLPPGMLLSAPPTLVMPSAEASEGGSSKSALLDQIRSGHKLRKIDVDRMKMEQRQKWKQEARKSVLMVRSLEDTIKSALETKFAFDDAEDDEEDDADWA